MRLSPVSFFNDNPEYKRHPNYTKTDQLPVSEVITGLPRPYHHTVIPLNAGSCLCSLGIRYGTGCFFVGSREYSSEFSFFTLTLGIGRYSNFRYFSWRSVMSSIIRAKRVSNCYIPQKKFVRVRATNLGFRGVHKTPLLSHATTV